MHRCTCPAKRPHFRIGHVALAASAAWSLAAHAIGLEECKPLEDDAKRLACYDSVSRRAVTAAFSAMANACWTTTIGRTRSASGSRWSNGSGVRPAMAGRTGPVCRSARGGHTLVVVAGHAAMHGTHVAPHPLSARHV